VSSVAGSWWKLEKVGAFGLLLENVL